MKYAISRKGIEFIRDMEGCCLSAYQDVAGVWTIGVGSTTNVGPGDKITEAEAEQRLCDDLEPAEKCVNYLVRVPIKQHQYDALVSLVFNIGCNAFRGSTLLKVLNAGDYEEAADEFLRWCRAGGKEVNGLLRRRKLESAMFENILDDPIQTV